MKYIGIYILYDRKLILTFKCLEKKKKKKKKKTKKISGKDIILHKAMMFSVEYLFTRNNQYHYWPKRIRLTCPNPRASSGI